MPCRRPTLEDADAIARVHKLAWQAAYLGIMPDKFLAEIDEKRGAERWREALRADPESTLVCERQSRIVATCRFGASRDHDVPVARGEIYSLNVDPRSWRRGVGRELLDACIPALRDQGLDGVSLWVATENERARRFYEAYGFSADGAERVDTSLIGAPLPETRYFFA